MKRILFLVIIVLSFTSIYAQNLMKKGTNSNTSVIESNNNTGLNDLEPTKENVLKALGDFEWDNAERTHKDEAYRILTHLGANYEHYQEYASGEGYVCGKLPSGYYLTIFTDSFGKKNKYHVRYGLDKNHSYFSTQAYSNETTYDIDKKTNPDYVAHYLLTDASNFKEDSSLGTLFGPIHALNYMVLNPPELLSVEARTNLLGGIVWEIDNALTFSFYVPVTLSEIDENTGFKPRDMIVGIIDKGKLDKIQLDNKKRRLDKAKQPLELVIFRQGQFLKKTWNPNTQYRYYTNSGFKNIVRDFRYDLVKMVLESGPVDLKLNAKNIVGGNAFSNRGHPLIGVIRNPKTYSKRILDILVKYGADVNMTDHWGNTPLHVAAGAFYHTGCSYFEHKKINDKSGAYGLRGSEEAYFHLIELGAKDNAEGLYSNSLKCSTPKQYYFLTFKTPEHIVKPKDFDWNALANAVVAGTGAALNEKQRQINETNAISSINQDYQNEVDKRIAEQKRQVELKNATYLKSIDSQIQDKNKPATLASNSNTVNTNYSETINSTVKNNDNISQSNQSSSLGNNKCVENPNWMPITYYQFKSSLLDPETVKATPYAINDCQKVINYRDQWVLNLRSIPNTLDEEWYPQLKKVEIVEIHDAVPEDQMQWKVDQIKSHPRQFLTYQGALNDVKDNATGIYWTLASAQEAADLRNKK